ncbi:MAG: cell division protein ZapA [Eubacteriales bacterium]
MKKTKLNVKIAGRDYNLVATENEDYIESLAKQVDDEMNEILTKAGFSFQDAAVLTAINLADKYQKEKVTAENLRHQVKETYEEAAALQLEISTLKQENFKLTSGGKEKGKK